MSKDWKICKFPDVVFIQEGPGIRKYEYEENGYPMINVRCVQDGHIDMSKSKAAKGKLATGKWKHFQIQAGDILFTISGTIGRSAIVKESDLPLLMNTSVVRFRPTTDDLASRFLYYSVRTKSFIEKLKADSTGTAIKNVGPTHIKRLEISYPPLPEQERIVAILDEAFEAIDTAIANTEKNLVNARELFESYRDTVLSATEDNWGSTTLGEIAAFKNGLNYTKRSKGDAIRIVGVKDFKGKFWVEPDEMATVQIDGSLGESYALQCGDILTVRSNGNKQLIGRCVLVGDDCGLASFSGFTIRIRLAKPEVNPEFLVHLLKSGPVHEKLVGAGGGANISSLNQKALAGLPLMLPPAKRQAELVRALIEQERLTNALTLNIKCKLAQLEDLKQSILQKAFTGELTASTDQTLQDAGV